MSLLKSVQMVDTLYNELFDEQTRHGGECHAEDAVMGFYMATANEAIETLIVCLNGLETGGSDRLKAHLDALKVATYNKF